MTRTPLLLALLLALSGCATSEELRAGRGLLRESEALERRGEFSESADRAFEAAEVLPGEAVALRLDVIEQLLELGDHTNTYYRARGLLFGISFNYSSLLKGELGQRYRALERRLEVRGYTVGPCLSVGPSGGDRDQDGYDDAEDGCPDEAEDFDAFEDDDGCVDRDNDGDGILDAARYDEAERRWINEDVGANAEGERVDCRNDPEDIDGFEDEDGCPDIEAGDADEERADPAEDARLGILDTLARGGALPPDVLRRLRERG